MAEEEIVSTESAPVASPVPSDHKRKLEEMEAEPKEDSIRKSEDNKEDDITNGGGVVADVDADADGSDAKRPRLDDNEPNAIVSENRSQENEKEEHKEEAKQPLAVQFNSQSVNKEEMSREASEAEGLKFETIPGNQLAEDVPSYSNEHEKLANNDTHEQEVTPKDELQEQSLEIPSQKEDSGAEEQPSSGSESMSRKIEVPNNKVGVLIGKAGDTIRFLQINSGARIQIMRDDEANLSASTRPVELIGNAESINQAEKLIKDVIAEADAGGSPSLVARGICTVQTAGVGEQILIQVPNEKVGLIIGKGGETIKNLQTRSGARIQLIPQHPPEGDQSKERTVRVTGDKKQIEMAREMIKEVMNQSVRPSTLSGGYSQHAYRPRGPAGPQWGSRGPHFPPTGYDYQQRRPYPCQNPQYPTSAYVNYPHQQMPSRGSFGPGWDSRPSATMHGPPQGGGYNYYGVQGGRVTDGPMYSMPSYPVHSHGPGPSPVTAMGPPPAQANYNYGQAQPDYGQSAPYAQQTVQPSQSYGHGYNEVKYENQTHMQHPYGGQGGTQISTYPQGSMVQGYGPQDQYGKPLSYSMPPPQGNQSQSYGQSKATQPGDVQYQGVNPSVQSYGPGAPTQQSYPYGSSMPMQSYPPYGSAPAPDGYNNSQPATASVPGYPQQSGQPAAGYSQSIAQQGPGYGQLGANAGYGAYPSSQPVYPEQTATNANYGYQGAADPAYGGGTGSAYGAAPTGQPNYTQPAPTQPVYEQQSITPSAAYGPTSAPVAYGKSSSPQPGYPPPYESNQMYGTHT